MGFMGEVVQMSTRLAMMMAAELPGVSVTALCAELGISRQTFYRLRGRYDKEGLAGLEPRSRRPLISPQQIDGQLEARICGLREQLPLDRGAQAIFYELDRLGYQPPSVRTIHRVLVRNGLVTAQPHKRPRASWRRFEYDRPNACWQIDATMWHLTGQHPVWIMDVLDDHSRVSTAAQAVTGPTTRAAWDALCQAATDWGMPAKVLSDNGSCFTSDFETNLGALGVTVCHSSPAHPQTCGKIERFHQTLKKWLRPLPSADTIEDLQQQLDRFRDYYNHHRPHKALHGNVPAQRHAATPPAQPGDPLPPTPPATITISNRKVGHSGEIHAYRYSIGLGRKWAGHTVTLIRYGQRVAVLDGTTPIRALTLDPTRVYQPLLSQMS
jgi:transposase InsO family protein